jgi:hypothetical protein
MLMELGYSTDTDKTVLRSRQLLPRITDIKQKAYSYFIKELQIWLESGYTLDNISGLLIRIYQEQRGGGPQIERDRKERRERLKSILARLKDDQVNSMELRKLAHTTLLKLDEIDLIT